MNNADQPAHPTLLYNETSGTANGHEQGLTKREYFAAMAMQGILSSCDGNIQGMEPNEPNIKYFAELSVKAAAELLKQLEPKQ